MSPEPGNPNEVEGVLNPAAIRGKDGELYLFPRLVAKGNYSRIGIARVQFDSQGDPVGVERLGIALEPEQPYEQRTEGGGCEDPRVSFVEPLGHYVMSYVALSPAGPRIALAASHDLIHWERIGLATFEPYKSIEFQGIDNKDSCIFPVSVLDPFKVSSLAMLHRPLFPGTRPEEKVANEDEVQDLHRESIWISFREMAVDRGDQYNLSHFNSHHRLAAPTAPWEMLKIGVGTPPVRCRHGWLLIYHGVREVALPESASSYLSYSAGVMVLDQEDPCRILYRSPEPILTPELPEDQRGAISRVVFPTGIDRRTDLGKPDEYDIYFGMADDRIGVARLEVPETLPS